MRIVFLFVAALLFAAPALAEEYEKGPTGGLMLDAGRHVSKAPKRASTDRRHQCPCTCLATDRAIVSCSSK